MTEESTPKVALVISTPRGIGGAEKVVLALAQSAAERGWACRILNPFDEQAASELRRATPSDSYRATDSRSFLDARRWMIAELEAWRPSVVQATLARAALLVATGGKLCPTVLSHQHGAHFVVGGMRLRAAVDGWATRRFDRVVAVSRQVERFLVSRYRVEPERVELIPNGWEGEPLPSAASTVPTAVTVAHLRAEKGIFELISAMNRVVDALPNARLVLVGDGPLRKEVERAIVDSQLVEHVRLTGAVDNVWPYFADAHVAVLPSRSESFGISALEGMAAGLPVIATEVGGLPELIKPGWNGLLVPSRDPGALAGAMIELLSAPDSAARMGEAARSVAASHHMEVTLDSYFSLYERLIR